MKENNCTAFPEMYWSECCHQHDLAYELQIPRAQADKELLTCVADSGEGLLVIPSLIVAWLMYSAVRVFGKWHYKK